MTICRFRPVAQGIEIPVPEESRGTGRQPDGCTGELVVRCFNQAFIGAQIEPRQPDLVAAVGGLSDLVGNLAKTLPLAGSGSRSGRSR